MNELLTLLLVLPCLIRANILLGMADYMIIKHNRLNTTNTKISRIENIGENSAVGENVGLDL